MERPTKTFVFNNNIAPTASVGFDFENQLQVDSLGQQTQKYVPLKNIQITNTGTETLNLFINNEQGFLVIPPGVILELKNKNIYRLDITNTGAINNAVFTFTINNDYSNDELTAELLKTLRGLK